MVDELDEIKRILAKKFYANNDETEHRLESFGLNKKFDYKVFTGAHYDHSNADDDAPSDSTSITDERIDESSDDDSYEEDWH